MPRKPGWLAAARRRLTRMEAEAMAARREPDTDPVARIRAAYAAEMASRDMAAAAFSAYAAVPMPVTPQPVTVPAQPPAGVCALHGRAGCRVCWTSTPKLPPTA